MRRWMSSRRSLLPLKRCMCAVRLGGLCRLEHIACGKEAANHSNGQQDGRSAAEVLSNCHMVFLGPAGVGKTTVRYPSREGLPCVRVVSLNVCSSCACVSTLAIGWTSF